MTTHSSDSDAGWQPGAGGPVNLTPVGTAVEVSGAGALIVADDVVASRLLGSVIARSHAAAKLTDKRIRKSLFGGVMNVRWRKG